MPVRSNLRLTKVALPGAVAAAPPALEAVRALTTKTTIWLWGDQALIDLEARSSLVGHNLLGVYDRYGWHHLGPLWLLVLGVFRWLGGGSAAALVFGSCTLQAVSAAAIVVIAGRLRAGLTGWWAALVLLGYEWSFGPERLGTVWAPYAIALPAALLVLLVARLATGERPWGPAVGVAVCASFLAQTDISTVVVVLLLVLVAPVLRWVVHNWPSETAGRPGGGSARKRPPPATRSPGWWGGGNRRRAAVLAAVLVVLWLPPVIQELTPGTGNLVLVYRFMTSHRSHEGLTASLKAAGTVFGSFPFRLGERGARTDTRPGWLVAGPLWQHLWYLVYLLAMVAATAVSALRRQRTAFVVAAASGVALVGAGWSVDLVYGRLYPYLVLWAGAFVVPAWVAAWLVLSPRAPALLGRARSAAARKRRPAGRGRRVPGRWSASWLPFSVVAVSAAISVVAVTGPLPMGGKSSVLGHRSWGAVSAAVSAPGVRTVYIRMSGADSMPDAAAIADEVVRHGRRVEVDRAALYFLDPSFAPGPKAQLDVVVCCGRAGQAPAPPGMEFRGQVGGQRIFISTPSPTRAEHRLRA